MTTLTPPRLQVKKLGATQELASACMALRLASEKNSIATLQATWDTEICAGKSRSLRDMRDRLKKAKTAREDRAASIAELEAKARNKVRSDDVVRVS